MYSVSSFATSQYVEMISLAYMCRCVGCVWHIYVNGRCIVVLFQKNSLGMRLGCLKGAWDVNGWYIGFGWKVHGMVHGKRSFIL